MNVPTGIKKALSKKIVAARIVTTTPGAIFVGEVGEGRVQITQHGNGQYARMSIKREGAMTTYDDVDGKDYQYLLGAVAKWMVRS